MAALISKIFKDHIFVAVLVFSILYIAAWNLVGSEVMIEALDIIIIPIAVAVVWTYGPQVVSNIGKAVTPVQVIRSGIILAWIATGLDRIWRLTWRELGYPQDMAIHFIPGLLLFILVIAGIMHAVALGVDMKQPGAITARRFTTRAILVGVVIATLFVVLRYTGWDWKVYIHELLIGNVTAVSPVGDP